MEKIMREFDTSPINYDKSAGPESEPFELSKFRAGQPAKHLSSWSQVESIDPIKVVPNNVVSYPLYLVFLKDTRLPVVLDAEGLQNKLVCFPKPPQKRTVYLNIYPNGDGSSAYYQQVYASYAAALEGSNSKAIGKPVKVNLTFDEKTDQWVVQP
jgi:hypothetical protein